MIQTRSILRVADNTGAKIIRVFKILGGSKRRYARIGDLVVASVQIAEPRKAVKKKDIVRAVVVRQRREYRRMNGLRIKFEDNAIVVCKDEKGNPKGTIFKGPIAKEACERWPAIAKVASIIV